MSISKKLSLRCTNFIKNNLSKTDEELAQIHYGIECIISNTLKLLLIFIVAYLLRIWNYIIIALVTFAILRGFASGIHMDTTIKCNIMNFIIFFGNTYLSLFLKLNKIFVSILFLISFIIIFLYAPADTRARPLTNSKKRKLLKLFSILSTIILYILCLLLNNPIYYDLIAFSIFIEAILITPFTYKLFKSPYANYKTINLSESNPSS